MKRIVVLFTLFLCFAGCRSKKKEMSGNVVVSHTLTSTTDVNGNQHPAAMAIDGSTTVACVKATGAEGLAPSCSINGQMTNQGSSTTVSNTVHLTCDGQAPLLCIAVVNQ
jgi:hypothetical protein